jgi:hypothetical protein
MSPPIGAIVLDTSAILHVVRGKDTGQAIEKACDLWSRPARPLVAVVSHGEVRAFALHRRWEEAKMKQIRGILGYTIPVDIRNDAVIDQ